MREQSRRQRAEIQGFRIDQAADQRGQADHRVIIF
jgi:hypothetical protein